MIRILVDSSSDYELEEIQDRKIDFVPITITMNEQNYQDGIDLEKDQFFELLIKNTDFPKTAQPSPSEFLAIFEDAKQKGDQVICILLSSGLSGTCQSAVLAKSMADYDEIYIIDSLMATYPIRILADYACKLVEEGFPAKEIVEKVESLKARVRLIAALDTLEYLSKGGRIPKSIATIGEMANIKPVITLSKDGTIGVLGKCLGKNKATAHLVKDLAGLEIDRDFPFYTIYSYGTDNCERFEEKICANGHEITQRVQLGATIGAHIGPGAFGAIFVTK